MFLDYLVAQSLCMQPAYIACIEYPRDPAKDELYPWLDLYKAIWVADTVIGGCPFFVSCASKNT